MRIPITPVSRSRSLLLLLLLLPLTLLHLRGPLLAAVSAAHSNNNGGSASSRRADPKEPRRETPLKVPPRPPLLFPPGGSSLRGHHHHHHRNGPDLRDDRRDLRREDEDDDDDDDESAPFRLIVPPNKSRSTGTKELLVIRIESPDGSTTSSEEDLYNDVFDDEVNLSKQYGLCSHSRLEIVPATGGPSVRNGIATLRLDEPAVGRATKSIYEEVFDRSVELLGRSLDGYDEVMICMPPGTTAEMEDGTETSSWVAYVPGESPYSDFLSVYSDGWCASVSAGMHEIGHTLGLHHANEGGDEYEDTSGQMGFSSRNEHGPRKCFNPSNSWHLGWYADRSMRLNPLLDAPFRTTLKGVADSDSDSDPAAETTGGGKRERNNSSNNNNSNNNNNNNAFAFTLIAIRPSGNRLF